MDYRPILPVPRNNFSEKKKVQNKKNLEWVFSATTDIISVASLNFQKHFIVLLFMETSSIFYLEWTILYWDRDVSLNEEIFFINLLHMSNCLFQVHKITCATLKYVREILKHSLQNWEKILKKCFLNNKHSCNKYLTTILLLTLCVWNHK